MITELSTTQGKQFALEQLKYRREHKPEKIDNVSLLAGSPMVYYCISCDHISDVKPESFTTPIKRLCKECEALKELGWLE